MSMTVYIIFTVSSTDGSKKLSTELTQLIQMFPLHEVTMLTDILDKSGSINDAVAQIVGDETSNDGK